MWTHQQITKADLDNLKTYRRFVASSQTPFEENPQTDLDRELNEDIARDIKFHIQRLKRDAGKTDRLKNQNCQICAYIPRVAGMAFTNSYCQNCGKLIENPSTDVNQLCDECARKYHLCAHCGGHLNFKPDAVKLNW